MRKFLFVGMLLFSILIHAQSNKEKSNMSTIESATFANGCFWCTEAIFQRLKGVKRVSSGYTGGSTKNPTYKEVVSGKTGHAEAIEIKFDSAVLSFIDLLDVFFSTHDPTTLNRQGYDVGTQYRSGIFFHNEEQKLIAEEYIKQLNNANVFDKPIVTEITKLDKFYKAEDYHQNYYNNNKNQGYCRAVINPKLEKFLKNFKDKIKK